MTNSLEYSTHQTIEPKVLYYGTPVVLLSTLNEDETTNITPISSTWALGSCLVLGIGLGGKALENLQRHAECVLNLPNPKMWKQVEALAPLTGKDPVPEYKQSQFQYEKNKFQAANLHQLQSEAVKPLRVAECPIQIEAAVMHIRIPEYTLQFAIVEVVAQKVHVHEELILDKHHIDPQLWSPLIYNFRHYFGLGKELGKTFRA